MAADLVILNARLRPLFAAPGTTGIAVAGGRILALGDDEAMRAHIGADSRVIDAGGRELMPGFIESHLHLMMGGASLSMLNMGALFGFEPVQAALREFAASQTGDGILLGYGVNYVIFGEGSRPDRHILDRIIADRPLLIIATDLHCAWANTRALELAGILGGADCGPGSEVVMGPDGLATGELREFAAMNRVKMLSSLQGRDAMDYRPTGAEPPTARAHDKAVLRAAGEYCARHGITRAVNMDGNAWQASLLRDLAAAGEMPVRVSLPLMLEAKDGVAGVALVDDFGPEVPGWLSFVRIKLFMDGVFDTWTALTVTDYPDRPGFRSEPLIPLDLFNAICVEADRRGLQLTTHAVGDGAVRAVIDGYEAARAANGTRDSRHRIEHIDTITPEDLDRLKPLGIIASMQPVHPPGSAGLPLEPTTTIMGRARWLTAFPWAQILAQDVPLAFGTDWPVSPLSPLYAIHCALTRQPWGRDIPDQRISLDDCLAAYTTGGAYADFAENHAGRLTPGYDADLVLIGGSLEGLAQSDTAARVDLTICGGKITYGAL